MPGGARAAAAGRSAGITWEDERGRWHAEISRGEDRPEVEVEG